MFKKLILVILLFPLFLSPVHASDLPQGIKPVQVTALSQELDIFGKVQFVLTFWNVGQLHSDTSYHEAVLSGKCLEKGNTDGWICVAEKPENSQKGTFSGGPDGTFTFKDKTMSLVNGIKATITQGGQEIVFTVQNPEAFAGWKDSFTTDSTTDSQPQTYDEKTSQELKPSDDTKGIIDNNEVLITKLIGDVNVSDPSLRRTGLDLYINAWKVMTGQNSNPESWRTWIDPKKGMKLTDGFQLKTGEGRAVVEFKDGTKFIIKQNSTITFKSSEILLDTGSATFEFKKIGKKIYITDKRGKFAIVGTKFEIITDKDNTLLKVYDGKVETENLNSKNKTLVSAGEEINITDKDLGNEIALTGEKTADIEKIEKEIIVSEKSQAGKFFFSAFGILIFLIIVFITIIFLLLRKKYIKHN